MQFDAVEARLACTRGGRSEQPGKRARQRRDMRLIGVGDALARAHSQRLELARRQHARKLALVEGGKARAHRGFRRVRHLERAAMLAGHGQEPLEEFARFGPPANRQKIDELDEQPRLAGARLPHGLDQRAQGPR